MLRSRHGELRRAGEGPLRRHAARPPADRRRAEVFRPQGSPRCRLRHPLGRARVEDRHARACARFRHLCQPHRGGQGAVQRPTGDRARAAGDGDRLHATGRHHRLGERTCGRRRDGRCRRRVQAPRNARRQAALPQLPGAQSAHRRPFRRARCRHGRPAQRHQRLAVGARDLLAAPPGNADAARAALHRPQRRADGHAVATARRCTAGRRRRCTHRRARGLPRTPHGQGRLRPRLRRPRAAPRRGRCAGLVRATSAAARLTRFLARLRCLARCRGRRTRHAAQTCRLCERHRGALARAAHRCCAERPARAAGRAADRRPARRCRRADGQRTHHRRQRRWCAKPLDLRRRQALARHRGRDAAAGRRTPEGRRGQRRPGPRRAAPVGRRRAQPRARPVERHRRTRPHRRLRAPPLRRAGRPHAERDGRDLRRPVAQLRRTQPPRQPAGAPPQVAGRRPRRAGGPVRRALGGDDGGPDRHPQGGWRVCAARPELPEGPHRLHGRRLQGAGAADAGPRGVAQAQRQGHQARHRLGLYRHRIGRAFRRRRRAAAPGLRDLHLGLDRQAQGRDGRAPQRRQLLRGDGSPPRRGRCRYVGGRDEPQLRHLGARTLLDADPRLPRRHRDGRRALRRRPARRGCGPPARLQPLLLLGQRSRRRRPGEARQVQAAARRCEVR